MTRISSETIPVHLPYDPGIFAFLAARAVPDVEVATVGGGKCRYVRTLQLAGGHGVGEVVWNGPGTEALAVSLELTDDGDRRQALAQISRLFDTGVDPASVDAVLTQDSTMAQRVTAVPGIRVPGHVDTREILIRALIGQQISVPAATTALGKLAPLGDFCTVLHPEVCRLFPSAHEIAANGADYLRGPARRIDTILNVAALLDSGRLPLQNIRTVTELQALLLPIPGIGPWTVNYVAMRVLGSGDVELPNDAAIRNGLKSLGIADPDYFDRFRPWRSYATLHVWRAAQRAAPAGPKGPAGKAG